MALEEALLAEDGFLDSHLGAEQVTNVEAHSSGFIEAASSYVDQKYYSQDQVGLTSPVSHGIWLWLDDWSICTYFYQIMKGLLYINFAVRL